MEQMKQVQAVKKALDLECEIQSVGQNLERTQRETFRAKPQPPVKETVNRTMPPIQPTIKFNWLLAIILLFLTSGVGTLLYYFAFYKPKKEAEIEQIKNSVAYHQQCMQAEAEFDRLQKELDEQFEQEISHYQTVVLPEYNSELTTWTEQHNHQLHEYTVQLEHAKSKLQAHYNETKIVPLQYRTIPALQYIYDMISSSDYTVREAIENYDKQEQRKLDLARLEEQQQANQLAYEQNQLAYEQNDLLERQNEIAQKARRDANIASVVGAIQRHNTNKMLGQFKKK